MHNYNRIADNTVALTVMEQHCVETCIQIGAIVTRLPH
jgi:hypothetical protein